MPAVVIPGYPFTNSWANVGALIAGAEFTIAPAPELLERRPPWPNVLAGSVDPRVVATPASVNSEYQRRSAGGGVKGVYSKYGTGDTSWTRVTPPSLCQAESALDVQDIIRTIIGTTDPALPSHAWVAQPVNSQNVPSHLPAPWADVVAGADMSTAVGVNARRINLELAPQQCAIQSVFGGNAWRTAVPVANVTSGSWACMALVRWRITPEPAEQLAPSGFWIRGVFYGAVNNIWGFSKIDNFAGVGAGWALGMGRPGLPFLFMRDTLGATVTSTDTDAGIFIDGGWHPLLWGRYAPTGPAGSFAVVQNDIDGQYADASALGSISDPTSRLGLYDPRSGLAGATLDCPFLATFEGADADTVLLGAHANLLCNIKTGIIGI